MASRKRAEELVRELNRLDAMGTRVSVQQIQPFVLEFSCPDEQALARLQAEFASELELLGLYYTLTQPNTALAFDQPDALRQIADLFGFEPPVFRRVYL